MTESASYSGPRFAGAYLSDQRKCLILDDGSEVALRPKSLALFAHLAKRADVVVAKEELFSVVWGGVSVSDDSLVQCIRDIRRALKDNDHQVLRTVPKQGYLLITDAAANPADARTETRSTVEPEVADSDPISIAPSDPATVVGTRWLAVAVIVGAIIGGLLVYVVSDRAPGPETDGSSPKIGASR